MSLVGEGADSETAKAESGALAGKRYARHFFRRIGSGAQQQQRPSLAAVIMNHTHGKMSGCNRRHAKFIPATYYSVALFLICAFRSTSDAFTFATPTRSSFAKSEAGHYHPNPIYIDSIAKVQGGSAVALDSSSALKSAAATLASPQAFINVWAGLDAFSGMMMAFAPSYISKVYGLDAEKEGKFSSYIVKAIGCVLIGHAISLICATVFNMSAQKALGFGILIRLLFLIKSFMFKVYEDFDAKTNFLSVNTVIMSWCVFSLLTGKGNPFVAAKTFSTAALLKASLLFTNPIAGAKKFFGIDIGSKDMKKTKALCKSLGLNLLTNAVFMLTLAFGIETRRAAGTSAVVWSILLGETTFISKSTALMGPDSENGNSIAVAYFLFSALLSYVLLAGPFS